MNKKRTLTFVVALATVAACLTALPLSAQAPSGAIFTTTFDGSEVNANHFPTKEDVYLDGGPGPGAPQTAAGLDDGDYYFQVTDPSGKTLLSTDAVECRRFTVSGGVITSVAPSDDTCTHLTGDDLEDGTGGAITVQLVPFDDTPNPGGVYKAWVTPVGDYAPGSGKHGFVPSHTKTDNFKIGQPPIKECDTVFTDRNTGERLSGLGITWIDTLGASNRKWSYFVAFWNIVEAHVEAVEDGEHYIVVEDQPGCIVREIYLRHEERNYNRVTETFVGYGPQAVSVKVNNPQAQNWFVKVYCDR